MPEEEITGSRELMPLVCWAAIGNVRTEAQKKTEAPLPKAIFMAMHVKKRGMRISLGSALSGPPG